MTLAQLPQIAMKQTLLEPRAPLASSSSPINLPTASRKRSCRLCSRDAHDDHGRGKCRPQRNQSYLDPGESAVGTAVNVRHLAATPVGRMVTGEAEVTRVDGRQIEFTVRATEGAKEIGAGSHYRVVIDAAKFTRRLK